MTAVRALVVVVLAVIAATSHARSVLRAPHADQNSFTDTKGYHTGNGRLLQSEEESATEECKPTVDATLETISGEVPAWCYQGVCEDEADLLGDEVAASYSAHLSLVMEDYHKANNLTCGPTSVFGRWWDFQLMQKVCQKADPEWKALSVTSMGTTNACNPEASVSKRNAKTFVTGVSDGAWYDKLRGEDIATGIAFLDVCSDKPNLSAGDGKFLVIGLACSK